MLQIYASSLMEMLTRKLPTVAGTLSNLTLNTSLVHRGGFVEYDVHNLYGFIMNWCVLLLGTSTPFEAYSKCSGAQLPQTCSYLTLSL